MPASVGNVFSDLGLKPPASETNGKRELGQSDFLKIMTEQLTHQDPFKPLENQEFISQMAQFSSLDSLQKLLGSFNSLSSALTSNQALQASSMVGRAVLVPGKDFQMGDEGGMLANVDLSQTTRSVTMEIKDSHGALVYSENISNDSGAPFPKGPINIAWDGKDKDGNRLPPGSYTVSATAHFDGNKTEVLSTNLWARVGSVNLATNGGETMLNLIGMGSIALSKVKEISG